MHKNSYLLPLSLCFATSLSSTYAAEPMLLQGATITEVKQIFQLEQPTTKLSATSGDTLQLIQQHTDEHKINHMRMQQRYAGFPVYGGYAILHTDKVNNVKMNGMLYRGLKEELGQPAPEFVGQAKKALQQVKAQYQQGIVSEEKSMPMVYVNNKHQAFWAYKVSMLVTHKDAIPERPTVIIDAKTWKPLQQWNDLKTLFPQNISLKKPADFADKSQPTQMLGLAEEFLDIDVKGVGYGGNSKIGLYQFGKDLPALPITRNQKTGQCHMENNDVKVVNMAHKYQGPSYSMRFKCTYNPKSSGTYWTGYKADGYDRENGAYSPSNDALYTGQVIKDLYMDWYGLDVLTLNNKPMKLVLRVHFGEGYENAYWDSQQMTFGDGDTLMYPLVSLGIGAHEVSHGFTEQHSNLEYFGQSGGINESFSDMAAQAAENYSLGKSSWAIGAEVMKEGSGYLALRYMDEPSRDGRSIDRADQFSEDMDVHHSSGVYNRLFYLLANQPQWSVKKAFHVMVKANMDYWTPYSTFDEAGCGIINAAYDLGYSVEDIKQALDQVAVSYQNCSES